MADKDEYRCPAGQSLIKRVTSIEQGKTLHTYWNSGCQVCVLKDQCTTSKQRRVKRWEHEAVLDAMLIRKQTVEHPFGTLKAWMGATHFLMKTLDHVKTER